MKNDSKDSLFLLAGVAALIVGFVLASFMEHAPKSGIIKVNSVP
jgi:hypothetical protein